MNIEYVSIPINKKQLRLKCHYIFDLIWQSKLMRRSEAYIWLSNKMFIPEYKCHFRQFDRTSMLIALDHSIKYLNDNYTNHDYPKFKTI